MANPPLPLPSTVQRVSYVPVRRELSTTRDQGMVQTREAQATVSPSSDKREQRRWIAVWSQVPEVERRNLDDVWASTAGGAQPAPWAPPGEAPILVHILEYETSASGPLWDVRALLEEAL